MEHFVTLFDQGFLPQGLCLHGSLAAQGEPFRLWVVCMDEAVEASLRALALPHLEIVPVAEVEAAEPRLLEVKPGRTRGEYCWTMTSFAIAHVLRREPSVPRATYVDADVFLFGPASRIFAQMDASGADVLLTDHAFAPEYDQGAEAGRFCVQFVPFRNAPKGREILGWWQDRCHEWCYARVEDGKFGDQMYLNDWPERWPGAVDVLKETTLTLAPWNVEHLHCGPASGIYHFHNLRIYEGWLIKLWHTYTIRGKVRKEIYLPYVQALKAVRKILEAHRIEVGFPPERKDPMGIYRRWRAARKFNVGWARA